MIVTSKPESGQRESLGARSQLVRLTLQVAIVMFTWVFRLMIKIKDVVKLIRLCEEDFIMMMAMMMMITEAAGDEGGVEARRLEGFPGIDESE